MSERKKTESVDVAGVTLVKRLPVGWRTADGTYVLVEIHRGLWEAYVGDTKELVASSGTRVGLVQRLAKIIDGTYTGPLPYTSG